MCLFGRVLLYTYTIKPPALRVVPHPALALDNKKNWFDIEKYLNRNLVLHPNDEYEVFEVDKS